MTHAAAASILGMTPAELEAEHAAGRIQSTTDKAGRRIYSIEALQAYLRSFAAQATP